MIGELEYMVSPHITTLITSFLPVKSDKAILGISGIIPNFEKENYRVHKVHRRP
jgi:hypothetical protein